jgi:hypothetical protein
VDHVVQKGGAVRHFRIALLAALLAVPLTAQDRKTIFVDRMEGLEPLVKQALQQAELPFDFIEETERPELKADLRRARSAYAELLYQHKLGRNESHRLELREVATNRLIAAHTFKLSGDENSRRLAAAQFAEKVRKAMAKQKR